MKNISMRLCFLAFVFLSVLFVSASPPKDLPVMVLNEKQLIATVLLPTNTMLELQMPSNPSTGYAWYVQSSKENSVLRMIANEQDEKGNAVPEYVAVEPAADGTRLAPGSPRTQVLRLVGKAQGNMVLTLAYMRLWEKIPLKKKHITVYSEGPFTGKLAAPKARLAYTPPPAESVMAPGLPASFDWRNTNQVTAVRNQGSCGSCWSFGSTAAVEAQMLIKAGITRDYSEQYLVSCNNDGWGCAGGWWPLNYYLNKYISGESAAGGRLESSFPYQAADVACNPPHTAYEKIAGWAYTDDVADTPAPSKYHRPTVAQVKQKIYDYGPVGTCVDATSWGSYTGGVWSHTGSGSNHIVAITGWDDAAGCFNVKNSWGASWGESGYIRMAYGSDLVGEDSTYVWYSSTNTAPAISTQPVSKSVAVGQTATFSVVASGTAPLSYKWYKRNVLISGATSSSYTTPAATTADNGATYYVNVSNSVGNVNSNTVTLTVTSSGAPTINLQITVGSGTATCNPNTTNTVKVTYWVDSNAALDVTTSPFTYVINTSGMTAGSTHSVYGRAYNSANQSVDSGWKYFVVGSTNTAPTITTQPLSKTVAVGATATFSVVATGTAPLSYKWYKRNVLISGATSANYTTPAATTADNGATYYVNVSNSVGNVNSSTVTLTVGSSSTLAVVSPNGGEQWARGSVHAIRWTAPTSTTKIDIALYRGTTFVQWITWNLSATSGTYNWTIPTSLAAGTTYKVMILDYNVRTLQDYSNAAFQLY